MGDVRIVLLILKDGSVILAMGELIVVVLAIIFLMVAMSIKISNRLDE